MKGKKKEKMKFRCIKTVEMSWYPKNSPQRYPFIEGQIYEAWDVTTSRTSLDLINEAGENHGIGMHWLHWKFSKFYKEHFVRVR